MKQSVLITGSSKGLGRELALVFAANGYNVILHGRNRQDLARVKREVSGLGADCLLVSGDIRRDKTIERLAAISQGEDVSILVNNAGVDLKLADGENDTKLPLGDIDSAQIDEVLETNLLAAIKVTRRIYPLLVYRGGGTIVNINSLCGLECHELRSIYTASKWGLRGFTDTFRMEAEKHKVRLISIYPSRIKTRPYFTFGWEPRKLAQKIYAACGSPDIKDLILDDRPNKAVSSNKRNDK